MSQVNPSLLVTVQCQCANSFYKFYICFGKSQANHNVALSNPCSLGTKNANSYALPKRCKFSVIK